MNKIYKINMKNWDFYNLDEFPNHLRDTIWSMFTSCSDMYEDEESGPVCSNYPCIVDFFIDNKKNLCYLKLRTITKREMTELLKAEIE